MPTRNVEDLQNPLYIGSGSDRLKIETDGTLVNEGSSTTWEDIQTSLIGRRLSSVAGSVGYNYEENTVTFSPNGVITDSDDRVSWNIQYPHKAITDGDFNVHVHWEQVDATDREFTLRYRIQQNGQTKNTSWTTVVVGTNANNAFSYTSGTLNQITPLVSIDMTGAGLSAVIQFQLTRSDAVAGDIEVTFVDAHYEADTQGSRQEYVK